MGRIRQTVSKWIDKCRDSLLSIFQPEFLRWLGRFLLFGAGYALVFFLFFGALRFTWPYLLAILVAWMMQPALRALIKHLHLKRGAAASFLLVMAILLFLGVVSVVVWRLIIEIIAVVQQLSQINLVDALDAAETLLAGFTLPFTEESPMLDFINQYKEQIDTTLSALSGYLSRVVGSFGRSMVNWVGAIPTAVMSLVVMFFAMYYCTRDWHQDRKLDRVFRQGALQQTQRFYQESLHMAGRYLSAYCKLIMITFVETLVIFIVADVPYGLLFAMLAAFFDIIPMIGVSLVYIPLAIYFAVQQSWFQVVAMIAGLIVVSVVRQVIEPKLVSRSINVHPLLMVGIFLLALQLGSLWVMLFLVVFAIVYQVAKTVGVFDENNTSSPTEETEAVPVDSDGEDRD